MKVAHKILDNVIYLPQQKKKSKVLQNIIHLIIMLGLLNVANQITIDIWRSLTGH